MILYSPTQPSMGRMFLTVTGRRGIGSIQYTWATRSTALSAVCNVPASFGDLRLLAELFSGM